LTVIPPFELPDDVQVILIQKADEIDKNYWDIGDICVHLEDELGDYYKASDIRREVSDCTRWRPETLRDIIWMCRRIPPPKRVYELSRHQYRACLAAGDLWEKYAEQAQIKRNGKPIPVSVIRQWIKDGDDELDDWERWWNRIYKAALHITSEAPETVWEICQHIIEVQELGLTNED
jgi:hypothetical protein